MSARRLDDYGALVAVLAERQPQLSRRMQQVARFLLDNPEDVAIYSIVELAARAGVLPSTISRFTREIGFQGFGDLQEVFKQRLVGPRMSYDERLRALARRPTAGDAEALAAFDPDVVFDTLVNAAMDALLRLREEIDRAALGGFVETLAAAEACHIVAARGAFGLGAYCYYGLSRVGLRAHLIANLGAMREQELAAVRERDVVLVMTFDDYTAETLEVARAAAARGLTLLVVTDNELSPVARLGRHTLFVKEARLGHFRSQVPAMALCQAIIMSLGGRLAARTRPLV
jgi:DNA-binding MurR/RpiR family transcriptional regulator